METRIVEQKQNWHLWVMIRGIPKEGWKRDPAAVCGAWLTSVMIRGIPKEGWKLFHGIPQFWEISLSDDQRNP